MHDLTGVELGVAVLACAVVAGRLHLTPPCAAEVDVSEGEIVRRAFTHSSVDRFTKRQPERWLVSPRRRTGPPSAL